MESIYLSQYSPLSLGLSLLGKHHVNTNTRRLIDHRPTHIDSCHL